MAMVRQAMMTLDDSRGPDGIVEVLFQEFTAVDLETTLRALAQRTGALALEGVYPNIAFRSVLWDWPAIVDELTIQNVRVTIDRASFDGRRRSFREVREPQVESGRTIEQRVLELEQEVATLRSQVEYASRGR